MRGGIGGMQLNEGEKGTVVTLIVLEGGSFPDC